ncbi:MAG: chromosomal replication initiator protein DnaA [Methylophilaceae bacterium]|jgi:chromosomal replication initiator protein
MQSEEIWEIIQSHLRKKLTPQQYKTWANPLLLSENEQSLEIVAPNHFIKQWISERFAKDIEALAKEHKYLKPITFETNNKKLAKRPEKKEIQKEDIISTNINVGNISKSTGLNKNLNFENFVTGRANQLATAAAKQVSEKPGESYNPLFIYGGVGLGKTHLLQSIGNKVKADNKDLKIKYLHAEKYVTDVVKAYEGKTFDQFKKNYHSLDLLLIDDIQFIGKKNRTQEEFFYAFNTLIENKKQIIITCDSYPKEIQGVDERLRTRFSWGLTVAIEPPELEMRVAILLKKASLSKINLPEDVAFFIAKQIRSNVRELEGALNRIVALSNFTKHPIDLNLAKEALKDLIAVRGRQVTIENIQKTVADYYKIKISDMVGKKRSRNFSKPRQIAMTLTRELTNLSYPEIGNYFGGRHHTTVMHACEEIEEQRLTNQSLGQDLGFLTQVLRG